MQIDVSMVDKKKLEMKILSQKKKKVMENFCL